MQRAINISTDVFAAIWANRREGENSEEEILRRLLGCAAKSGPPAVALAPTVEGGVYDTRNNVHFAEGAEIFRTYKRREYLAIAHHGSWVRTDDGRAFPTLNQLNASITATAENVWNGNWKYRTPDGLVRSIAELRR